MWYYPLCQDRFIEISIYVSIHNYQRMLFNFALKVKLISRTLSNIILKVSRVFSWKSLRFIIIHETSDSDIKLLKYEQIKQIFQTNFNQVMMTSRKLKGLLKRLLFLLFNLNGWKQRNKTYFFSSKINFNSYTTGDIKQFSILIQKNVRGSIAVHIL